MRSARRGRGRSPARAQAHQSPDAPGERRAGHPLGDAQARRPEAAGPVVIGRADVVLARHGQAHVLIHRRRGAPGRRGETHPPANGPGADGRTSAPGSPSLSHCSVPLGYCTGCLAFGMPVTAEIGTAHPACGVRTRRNDAPAASSSPAGSPTTTGRRPATISHRMLVSLEALGGVGSLLGVRGMTGC